MQRLFILLLVFSICCGSPSIGLSQSSPITFVDTPEAAGTNLQSGVTDVANWVFWFFYVVGGIFMGIGAFKLKQGDMGGFGKNFAGGATLFFVPTFVEVFKTIGSNSLNGG